MRNPIPKMPRTAKEALARSLRTVDAIDAIARQSLMKVAARWDEGAVGHAVDEAMASIASALDELRATMREEVAIRAAEEAE